MAGLWGSILSAVGLGGGEPAAIAPLPTGPTPAAPVVTKPFDRAAAGDGQMMSAVQLLLTAATTAGRLGPFLRPEQVPWYVIFAMGFDPWIYIGEEFFSAPLRDPTLYYLEHSDPGVQAEAEAWLKPIGAELLDVGTRAIAWGAMPFVVDWRAEDLTFEVNERNRTIAGHQHPVGPVHDLYLGDIAAWKACGDRLAWLQYDGATYLGEASDRPGAVTRAFWPTWRKQFGDFAGQGSRRRAYAAWYRGEMDACRQDRYLDRSVDPPRLAYAPPGTMELNGKTVRCIDVMGAAIDALTGGGTAVFPPNMAKDGKEREWSVAPMQLPDVSDVWHKRMDQVAVEKFAASLVPPAAAGMGSRTFAGAKVPADLFVELLRSGSEWTGANVLQPIVNIVHFVNHGTKRGAPPRVAAREIPAIKVKRLTEVFKAVATQARRVPGKKVDGAEGEPEDREVTLAELIDESIIDDMNVKRRPTDEAAREKRGPAPGAPGRPIELDGDREERRESSPTDEGREDVGGDDTDRQERE